MKWMEHAWVLCATVGCLSMPLGAVDTIEDATTKTKFPAKLVVSHDGKDYNLDITGTATRTKFFVNVYGVAHYIQDPIKESKERAFDQVMDEGKAKALVIQWVHSADSKKIKDGYIESFKKVLGDKEFGTFKPQIDQFVSFFSDDAKVGDTDTLRWFPDGTLEVEVNGQVKGTIKDPQFSKVVWAIWLGPKSVVNRNKLVNQLFAK